MDLCVFTALSHFFPSITPDIESVVIRFASMATSVHPLPRQYLLPTHFKYAPQQWNVPIRMMWDLYFTGSLQIMGYAFMQTPKSNVLMAYSYRASVDPS